MPYKPRTKQLNKISELNRGDIVQNKGSGRSYVIADVGRYVAIGVRTIKINNPKEWLLFNKEKS
jgi:hypothetical protein